MVTIDEGFRALIPPLTEGELAGLRASLVRDGCRDALCLWGDVLLDGYHRHMLCTELDLPFRTAQVDGLATRADAEEWVIRHQFGRRNLQPFQRAELALRLEPMLREKAKGRQAEAGREKLPQISAEAVLSSGSDARGGTVYRRVPTCTPGGSRGRFDT